MRRPVRLAVLAATTGLVVGGLAACGDPGAGATADPTAAPTATATPTPTPTVEDVPDRPRFETPLEQLRGEAAAAGAHDPDSPEGLRWAARVTACMTEQGYVWDRTPVPGSVDLREDTFAGEYLVAHGYGRVEQARMIARLTATPPPDVHAGWTQEERDAYDLALQGGYLPGRDGDQDAWVDGCTGIASREVYGEERDGVTMQTDHEWERWVDFEDDLVATYRAAEAPVLPDALLAWQGCMAAAGFPETAGVADPLDVDRLVEARIVAAEAAVRAAGRGGAFADSPELAAVGDYEIALVRADQLGCREAYDRTRYEARLAAEEAFVAERPEEVEGWKAYQQAQVAPRT